MGSKRKPFITAKAISEAVIRSGEQNNWSASQIIEIWELASLHLCEQLANEAFADVLRKSGSPALFKKHHYKVTGSQMLRFAQPLAAACNPIYILSDRVRLFIKDEWPIKDSAAGSCQWHDFSDSLLRVLMRKKVVPHRLKGKKLEQDLGL